MKRREFLKNTALLGLSSLLPMGAFPNRAFAAGTLSAPTTKLLIVNLNGGIDPLSALQPTSGAVASTLASMRPTLYKDPSTLLSTGVGYSFHNGLSSFKSLWDGGELSAILNVGCLNMSRSHLDAEVGLARVVADRLTPQASGFLGRLGEACGWGPLGAMSVSGSDLTFAGTEYNGLQVRGLESFRFTNGNVSSSESTYNRDTLYSISQSWPNSNKNGSKISESLSLAVDYSDLVYDAVSAASFPNSYGQGYVARAFRDAEVLLSTTSLGNYVSYIRLFGYDTHSNQETNLVSLFSQLNSAFTTFVANMKAKGAWNNLIVLFVSEFGRTIKENGSAGTDHGGANTVFLSGGRANSAIYGEITPTDLTSAGWLQMKYNVVEVYRRVVEGMGIDPNLVIGPSQGPSLAGLLS